MKKKRRKLKKKRNPYPLWKAIVLTGEYIICRMREKEPTGWRVIYHVTELGTKDWKSTAKFAKKCLEQIVSEEGGSNQGVEYDNEFIPHFQEQLGETDTESVEINGEEVCFETDKATKIMQTIVKCARQHRRIAIVYKKSNGRIIKREIAPYSMKDDFLFATDTKDGNTRIKGFRIYNIRSAKRCLHKYRPQWEIKF